MDKLQGWLSRLGIDFSGMPDFDFSLPNIAEWFSDFMSGITESDTFKSITNSFASVRNAWGSLFGRDNSSSTPERTDTNTPDNTDDDVSGTDNTDDDVAGTDNTDDVSADLPDGINQAEDQSLKLFKQYIDDHLEVGSVEHVKATQFLTELDTHFKAAAVDWSVTDIQNAIAQNDVTLSDADMATVTTTFKNAVLNNTEALEALNDTLQINHKLNELDPQG